MKQGQIAKDQLRRLALAATLLFLCAWAGASITQAAIATSVVGWGQNYIGDDRRAPGNQRVDNARARLGRVCGQSNSCLAQRR
jgi:hypothetical protein